MSAQSKFTIRVTSQRGASTISYSTGGRYINLATNTISDNLPRQPVMPTATAKAFWQGVLAIVTADVNALP